MWIDFQVNRKLAKELEELKEKEKSEQTQRVHHEQLSARVSSSFLVEDSTFQPIVVNFQRKMYNYGISFFFLFVYKIFLFTKLLEWSAQDCLKHMGFFYEHEENSFCQMWHLCISFIYRPATVIWRISVILFMDFCLLDCQSFKAAVP